MIRIPTKKLTFEDKFDRKYACWKVNDNKAWDKCKTNNRRALRRKIKKGELDE